MRGLVVLMVATLAGSTAGCGCSERGMLGDAPDGGFADATLGRDAASDGATAEAGARDASAADSRPPWDAGTCAEQAVWHLQPRAIHAVSLVDAPEPRQGVTERLLVEVQLLSGSCEELGHVSIAIMPGDATDFIELRAWVWTLEGDIGCTADAPIVSTVALVPGRQQGNPNVVVTDGHSPGGGLRLTYGREYCSGIPECQCYPGSPAGTTEEYGDCRTDCSCAAGLSCIGYWGFIGPMWSCLRPCADFLDCDRGERCPTMVADGPSYVCHSGDECDESGDCPEGFTCVDPADGRRFCQDQRLFPTWGPCACDHECPPGQRCVWDEDMAECQIPCTKASDCPQPEGAEVFVCGTPSFCIPLE